MSDPGRTVALVVGIESYGVGAAWDLDGPVPDAERFVRWLLARGVPPERIHCALSPIARNRPRVDRLAADLGRADGIPPADGTTVRDLVTACLRDEGGEHLAVFWGGHGAVFDRQRCLFVADSGRDAKYVLRLRELLDLAASQWTRGLSDQVFVVDVCGVWSESLRSRYRPGGVGLPVADARAVRQYVLCATHPGEAAANDAARSTGAFSRELLSRLEATDAATWPPDYDRISARLVDHFRTEVAADRATQVPQVFDASTPFEGERLQQRFRSGLEPAEDPVRDACEPLVVGWAELARLERLVRALAPAADRLVAAALAATGAHAPPAGTDRRDPLGGLLPWLAERGRRSDGAVPLVDFVDHLVHGDGDAAALRDLRAWSDAVAREREARRAAPVAAAPAALHLLVMLTRVGAAREVARDRFRLRAWTCRGEEAVDVTPAGADAGLALEGVPEALDAIIEALGGDLVAVDDRFTIEFILPGLLLSLPAQSFLRGGVIPLGEQWPVVVRPLERLKQQGCWSKWARRFDRAKTAHLDPELLSEWVVSDRLPAVPEVRRALADERRLALRLAFVPGEGGRFDERLLKVLLYEGVAIALWPQQPAAAEDALRARLEALFARTPLESLPEELRQERRRALADAALAPLEHVALLWDDPDRIPPEFRPSGRREEPVP